MHVGLNLIFLVPGATGGMETYARELIPELVAAAPDHRFTAFVSREGAAGDGPWHDLDGCVVVPVNSSNRVGWIRGEQQLLAPLARRAGVELVHSLASTAPAWGPFRRVTTIHDLIYRLVPQAHPGLRSLGMRVLVPLAVRRSDRIIVPSASTREDLRRVLGVAPERVDVVPHGVGSTPPATPLSKREVRGRLDARDRQIVLTVSAKLAHKNLTRLISALASIAAAERPLLVLPGYPTAHEQELREHARQLGVEPDVRLLGWVSGAELEALYGAAACFVFPSLAEGFGLPVLEAMSRGVPVACSARGALAEVAGDAALLFNPLKEVEIGQAIRRLIDDRDEAARLASAGRVRAAQFSWQAAAAGTLAAYRRAVSAALS
ncbi:MAG: glycosyltransferase family 4 protein [Solirubrobacteraceae bacterium]